MGIRFLCPNGHKLHVKSFLAGRRGICPQCGERFYVPTQSMPTLRVASATTTKSTPTSTNPPATPAVESASPATGASEQPSSLGEGNGQVHLPAEPLSVETTIAASADTNVLWYVRRATGEQYGPADTEVLRRWVEEGRVPEDCFVWREGWPDWRRADTVFRYRSSGVVGSDFDFDPAWLQPTAQARPVTDATPWPQVDGLAAKSNDRLHTRRRATRRLSVIVAALVAAVLALLPLLIYVLIR
jgi:hypothetical protein